MSSILRFGCGFLGFGRGLVVRCEEVLGFRVLVVIFFFRRLLLKGGARETGDLYNGRRLLCFRAVGV